MNYPPVKPYYLEPDVLMLGAEKISMEEGNMFVYNIERLICDCLKFEEKLDRTMLQQLLRQYIEEPQKDIQKLLEYARIIFPLQIMISCKQMEFVLNVSLSASTATLQFGFVSSE